MSRFAILLAGLVTLAAMSVGGLALAQNGENEGERSRFVRFVERQISTEDRQIRLGTIDGALSSDVRISQITIADRGGVWLTVRDVHLVWSRFALLRGRLDIDRLEASAIEVSRKPLPAAGDGEPIDDTPFSLPNLPVAVAFERLAVPEVRLAEGVVGPAAALSLDGAVTLNDDGLDADLAIERQDRPGTIALEADFGRDDARLALDLSVSEPENGVIANALSIPGAPSLSLTVQGDGPVADYEARLALATDGEERLSGTLRINETRIGQVITLALAGDLSPLVASLYQPYVSAGTELVFNVVRAPEGGTTVREGRLRSGAADLSFDASLAPDFVPVSLAVNGRVGRQDGTPLPLPGGGADATLGRARIDIELGGSRGEAYRAEIAVEGLDTPVIVAPSATLSARGEAANLSDPDARRVTFTLDGNADGLASRDRGVADALGSALQLRAEGAWRAGEPVTVDTAELSTERLSARLSGTIGDGFDGRAALDLPDLSAFAGLAGRDLSGALDIVVEGSVAGAASFDLAVDGTARNLALGVEALDPLLEGLSVLSGRAARSAANITFDTFALTAPRIAFTADGTVSNTEADLRAAFALDDLGDVLGDAGGRITADLDVSGDPANPTVMAVVESPRLVLDNEPIDGLRASFDGRLDRPGGAADPSVIDVTGTLQMVGDYRGAPLTVSADIATAPEPFRLADLRARIAGAALDGDVVLTEAGRFDGEVRFNVPDLAALAPLALTEASGVAAGTVRLSADSERQDADVALRARDVSVPGAQVGFADVQLSAVDVFGVPQLNGSASVRALSAGGYTARSAELRAARTGSNATRLDAKADFGSGRLTAGARLDALQPGLRAALTELVLEGQGLAARLAAPTEVTVRDGAIDIDDTRLSVGGGSITLGGRVAGSYDLTAELNAVPFDIADLVRPDLAARGTVSGRVAVTGRRDAPAAAGEIDATGVTAAPLRAIGIEPVSIQAAGRFAHRTLELDRLATDVGSGSLTASGTVGERLDLRVDARALPLALANAVRPDLGLAGTLSANGAVRGTLAGPVADVTAELSRASAAPLREAGLAPIDATLDGRVEGDTLTVRQAQAFIAGGEIRADGRIGPNAELTVTLDALPLSLANAFAPDLELSGPLNGTVTVSGALPDPDVTFDIAAPAIDARLLAEAGLPTASAELAGRADIPARSATLSTALVTIGGGRIEADGTVGDRLDVSVDLTNVPLALANAGQLTLGAAGTVSGSAATSGRLFNPEATFDITARGSLAPTRRAGLGVVTANAAGRFAGGEVTLSALAVNGGGLQVDGSGTVDLAGPTFAIDLQATAPLSLANPFLATRGARLDGTVRADVSVDGTAQNPDLSGTIATRGATFNDPSLNLRLEDIAFDARLAGNAVVIDTARATLGDGRVGLAGRITIPDLVADLNIVLDNARYGDGRLFVATVSGDIAVTGPVLAGPSVTGRIDVDRAEISVPTRLSGTQALINVEHVGQPADVARTLRRARVGPFAPRGDDGGTAGAVLLDITVDAPSRIFVRGRGIDAELGGQVRITGPVNDIVPVGRFELIRGRLVIIGQRIEFVEGSVTLFGDLNPFIRLVAETRTTDIVVRVIVEGEARDPEVRFISEPELPQDEVLAQLLFGSSIADLSPFQLAQLAAAAAELAGGSGGPNIVEQVRVFSGFDNLEIISTPSGGTAVQAGRYIAENIYIGVRGGEDTSGVTLNLDVTDNVKLRAEALTNDTSVGVFFEREY